MMGSGENSKNISPISHRKSQQSYQYSALKVEEYSNISEITYGNSNHKKSSKENRYSNSGYINS